MKITDRMVRLTALSFAAVLLSACSGILTPEPEKLLPDSGPTTQELLTGKRRTQAVYGSGAQADYLGIPLLSGYTPDTSRTLAHISEIQRDFHRIPNPEITAYVYSHLNGDELPVPGYFTLFKLYERDHYGLEQEGYHAGQ